MIMWLVKEGGGRRRGGREKERVRYLLVIKVHTLNLITGVGEAGGTFLNSRTARAVEKGLVSNKNKRTKTQQKKLLILQSQSYRNRHFIPVLGVVLLHRL